MYTVTHKRISVNSNNISGKSSKPLEKDTEFECLQLTPLLLLDIAERCTNIQGQNGVRFRHLPPENSCPKSRSKTRQRFPSEVHTEIRRQHCQISVNTHSQFTLTTHASLSGDKPPNTCNYTSNKISQGNGGKNLQAVHQTSVGSRSPKKGSITQDCQNLTVLHAYEIGPIKRTQR